MIGNGDEDQKSRREKRRQERDRHHEEGLIVHKKSKERKAIKKGLAEVIIDERDVSARASTKPDTFNIHGGEKLKSSVGACGNIKTT